MKRRILVLLFLIFWIVLPNQVIANNQGFDWGIEEDQSVQITLEYLSVTDYESNESLFYTQFYFESLLVNITGLPDIQDDIDSIPYLSGRIGIFLPRPNVTIARVNGTEIPEGWFVLWQLTILQSRVAYPIGNWAALSNIVKEYKQAISDTDGLDVKLIDTPTRWGWEKTFSLESRSSIQHTEYFKKDGTIAMYHINDTYWAEIPSIGFWRDTSDTLIQRVDKPVNEAESLVMQVIIVVGIASLIVIVIVVVYRSKL